MVPGMLLSKCPRREPPDNSRREILAMKIKTNMKSGTTVWGG